MEQLRLQIQWEARQILEAKVTQNTEVKRIVTADFIKDREWRDYIRLNKKYAINKTQVVK